MGYHIVRRRVISTPSDVQIVSRCPGRTFILPQKCHTSVLHTLLYKLCCMKTIVNIRGQAWNRTRAKCWVKHFILHYKHHAKNFIEDSGYFKHPKNVKSISNTTGSHLVSCYSITRPANMKG